MSFVHSSWAWPVAKFLLLYGACVAGLWLASLWTDRGPKQ